MAKLTPVLVVTDVPANSTTTPTVNTVTSVTQSSITWEVGKPESISYRAVGQDAADHLTPGRAPGGTRIVGPSLDGGTNQDSRMLSTGAQVTLDAAPSVSESGSGLGAVLATGGVERKSVQQVTLRDVLTAPTGTMRQQLSPSNTLLPTAVIPATAGLQYEPIGPVGTTQAAALTFTYVVDPSVQTLVLDLDANRDTPLRGLDVIVANMGSLVDVQRAQYVIDSGDFGVVEGVQRAQTVTIGHKDASSRFTFDGRTLTAVPQMVLQGTAGGASTTDMCYSCAFKGGDTRWGMPDGGTITGIKTTNRTWLDAVGDYRVGLPIVSLYVDRDHGGVYSWVGDGELHPISQAMGVTDLWYDEHESLFIAATDAGVYWALGDPGTAGLSPWRRYGTMALKVSKLCKDGGVLYALCAFADGSPHILQYPAAGGTVGNHGYDGWSHTFAHAGLVDFAVCGGVLYVISSASGHDGVVSRFTLPGGPLKTITIPPVTTAGDVIATGLDPITVQDNGSDVQGIFVRTSQGSAGLYYIDGIIAAATNSYTLYPAGTGLVDDFNAPVRVNQITCHPTNIIRWADGQQVSNVGIWAATNKGIYASQLLAGSFGWRRTDGQGDLGDVEVQAVASAPPRTYLGQVQTRVWAVTPSTILESDDGTLHFTDMLARKLDAGPAFYALWLKRNAEYPNLNGDTLLYPDPVSGPYQVTRYLDGLGSYAYIMTNPASTAPGWAHRYHESPQLSTGSLVSEIRGSQLLIEGMARFLAYTKDAQLILDVDSKFSDTADALRFLRPTHLVTLDGDITLYLKDEIRFVDYVNEPFYVLRHTITVDGAEPGTARTKTRIAKLLLDSRADPERIISDIFYQQSRQTLYAKGH